MAQLAQRTDGGDVLHDVASLPIAEGDALATLFQRQQAFDDRHAMRDKGRHQRPGERAEGFAVDAHAMLFVAPDQAVAILPVAQRAFERHFLGVGDVVRNATAFVGRKTGGQGDFTEQPRIRRAVTYLHRLFQRLDHAAALGQTVIDGRKTIEQRSSGGIRAFDAFGSLLIVIEPGVGINRRRQQVAGILKELQQLDMLIDQCHPGTRLAQGLVFAFSLGQRAGKAFAFR